MNPKVEKIVVKRGFAIPKNGCEILEGNKRLSCRFQGNICVVHMVKTSNREADCEWVCRKLEEIGILQKGVEVILISRHEGWENPPEGREWQRHEYEKVVKSEKGWKLESINDKECQRLYKDFVLKEIK